MSEAVGSHPFVQRTKRYAHVADNSNCREGIDILPLWYGRRDCQVPSCAEFPPSYELEAAALERLNRQWRWGFFEGNINYRLSERSDPSPLSYVVGELVANIQLPRDLSDADAVASERSDLI